MSLCPCPPCPVLNIRIRVTQVVTGPMNTIILTLCADDGDTLAPFPPGTQFSWTANIPFVLLPGDDCIQVTINPASPVLEATVTITDKRYVFCKSSQTYINNCPDDTLSISYYGDCETGKTDVYACVNNNCAYNPLFLYSWDTPGAAGAVFIDPAHYQFNMQQTIPPPCNLIWRVSALNQLTGCQMSAIIAQNSCNTRLTDWCNVPIGQSPFALLLACA